MNSQPRLHGAVFIEQLSKSGSSVHRSSFIFPLYPDYFHRVEKIIQGVCSVPELVLFPEAGGYREKGELIHVRAFGDHESGVAGLEPEAPPPKKPSSVQSTSSMVSFMQVATSCSSSM